MTPSEDPPPYSQSAAQKVDTSELQKRQEVSLDKLLRLMLDGLSLGISLLYIIVISKSRHLSPNLTYLWTENFLQSNLSQYMVDDISDILGPVLLV